VVKILIGVFWVEMPYSVLEDYLQHLQGENESSNVLQNGGILPQHYMASQTRRPQLNSVLFIHFLCNTSKN
jgi:hypothetical protein